MKRVIVVGIFFILLSCGANAQTKTGIDFFTGKWSVLIKGTPNGDAKMIVVLEKKDTLLTGVVQDTTGVEISKITSSELSGDKATVYFNAQGYDVSLMMEKKDDENTTGSMLGMFEAVGTRIKEEKQ